MRKKTRKRFTVNEIGLIRTPYKNVEEIPCQSIRSKAKGTILVYPEYAKGLKDIEGFSHIVVLYRFHKAKRYRLLGRPFLDNELRGIFSIRAPRRPNYIGISTLKLEKRKGSMLKVSNADMLDGTPLLDIKPYVPQFEKRKKVRIGRLKGKV